MIWGLYHLHEKARYIPVGKKCMILVIPLRKIKKYGPQFGAIFGAITFSALLGASGLKCRYILHLFYLL